MQAVDLTAAKYADEFRGEDSVRPQLRADLYDALRRIVETKELLVEFIGAWDLPDEHSEALAAMDRLRECLAR